MQESLHVILKPGGNNSVVREGAGGDFSFSKTISELEADMMQAAGNLDYEKAALIRDQIAELKSGAGITKIDPKKKPVTYAKGKRRAAVASCPTCHSCHPVPELEGFINHANETIG